MNMTNYSTINKRAELKTELVMMKIHYLYHGNEAVIDRRAPSTTVVAMLGHSAK